MTEQAQDAQAFNTQAFNNDIWNDYYEQAWQVRKDLMQRIISEGERHPLRVISKLESIMRFSHQERILEKDNPRFIFEEDSHYVRQLIPNVHCDREVRSIQLEPVLKLPTGLDVDQLLPHRDGYQRVPDYTYNDNIQFLVDFTRLRDFDAVIELGSGFGQNLFKLYYQGGPNVPYYACEYTQSGVSCTDMLAQLDADLRLEAHRFDYKNPDFSFLPSLKKVLVFTCHSIEQVTYIPNELIERISAIAQDVTCIHIEPFGFQLKAQEHDNELDREHRELFAKNGWNQNLAQSLVFHHLNNTIELTYMAANVMGGTKANPSSLALWSSVK